MNFYYRTNQAAFDAEAAQSMRDALWAIANMQIQPDTNKSEVLALCMSIARIELEKWSTVKH